MKLSYVLNELGIDGIAYSYETAIMKVHSFVEQRIPIVGGDVFLLVDDSPTSTDDSWYCEQMFHESYIDYVYRSGKVALEYINNQLVERLSNETFDRSTN